MPHQQETLAELLQALKDSWESTPFWTDAEGTRALNQALRWWNLFTGMWKREVVVLTTAGSPYVTLPATITYGMTVVWGPTGRAITPTCALDLDYGRPRWEEDLGTPEFWCPNGLSEIIVTPAHAAGGAQLLVNGVAATPLLVDPTDYIDLGPQDSACLVRFALHLAAFKRGAGALQTTTPFLREFLAAAAAQNTRLELSGFYRKFMGLDQQRGFRPVVRPPAAPAQGQGA